MFPPESLISAPDGGEPLVDLAVAIAGLKLDIRYARADNFLGRAVYGMPDAYLRHSAAQAFATAHHALLPLGYGLLVWDAYRPLSVQRLMWEMLPDSNFVAPPERGSNHNRAAAVDVALVHVPDGQPARMPTDFDYFTERARPDFQDLTAEERHHRDLLARVMIDAGFTTITTEWWHFNAPQARGHGLLDVSFEELRRAHANNAVR